ncbi:MAG: winged helix-turn-helix domain-containing protein [Sandaracinus sp.]
MGRSATGEAIGPKGRTAKAKKKLRAFIAKADKESDLACWRRGRAILGYIEGRPVIGLAAELGITRGAVNKWLRWYNVHGVEGLFTGKAPGRARRLSDEQRDELRGVIEAGPIAAGYRAGVWTGPMIGDLINERFGVRYHNHHVPRLLHELGFSVQRPRKKLARADVEAQANWLRVKFPAIKKKQRVAAAS